MYTFYEIINSIFCFEARLQPNIGKQFAARFVRVRAFWCNSAETRKRTDLDKIWSTLNLSTFPGRFWARSVQLKLDSRAKFFVR